MGQPNFLPGAFAATTALMNAIRPALHLRQVVRQHDRVAGYRTAWGESGAIVASQSVNWVLIDGTSVSRKTTLTELPSTLAEGSRVGSLTVMAGRHSAEVPLVTEAAINGPDLGWRLTRGL
jgi:hypothetical protein